jgi:hypothetical protein
MPCTPFSIGGARGFICTRRPRPRCACGTPASLQCDAPTKRRSGTCDRHLCTACAVEVGPDRHLCPTHATSGFAPTNEAPEADAAPVQRGLF